MLKEIVEKGHYCFVEKVDSWQDAIRQSYAPLLKDNTVENEYVEAVIECVNKYGPYIVIVPGIADATLNRRSSRCKEQLFHL